MPSPMAANTVVAVSDSSQTQKQKKNKIGVDKTDRNGRKPGTINFDVSHYNPSFRISL